MRQKTEHISVSVLLARHQILDLGGNRRGANLDETLVGVVSKATNEREKANKVLESLHCEAQATLSDVRLGYKGCYSRHWIGLTR